MKRPYITSTVRQRVAQAARHRCGYCLTQTIVIGMPLHIEHLIPIALGGSSEEANLWLACQLCNGYKGTQTHAVDPQTGELVALFNPRTQEWTDHFEWQDGNTLIVGQTSVGRATVTALKLNLPLRVYARGKWVAAGWHPPTD